MGRPVLGCTPWGAPPLCGVPPAFGGVVPPLLMGGGTPDFNGVMRQVMPQFGVASEFGSGLALGSPAFRPPVFPGVGWGGAFPHPSGELGTFPPGLMFMPVGTPVSAS